MDSDELIVARCGHTPRVRLIFLAFLAFCLSPSLVKSPSAPAIAVVAVLFALGLLSIFTTGRITLSSRRLRVFNGFSWITYPTHQITHVSVGRYVLQGRFHRRVLVVHYGDVEHPMASTRVAETSNELDAIASSLNRRLKALGRLGTDPH